MAATFQPEASLNYISRNQSKALSCIRQTSDWRPRQFDYRPPPPQNIEWYVSSRKIEASALNLFGKDENVPIFFDGSPNYFAGIAPKLVDDRFVL